MRRNIPWMLAVFVILTLGIAACSQAEAEADDTTAEEPASVEHVDGSEFSRVILTPKAAERIGVQTDVVRDEQVAGSVRMVMPYSALLYGPTGETWTFTNPEPLVFVREPVSVETIEGDLVILTDGPPPGTAVVTVGAAELIGTEFGVGH